MLPIHIPMIESVLAELTSGTFDSSVTDMFAGMPSAIENRMHDLSELPKDIPRGFLVFSTQPLKMGILLKLLMGHPCYSQNSRLLSRVVINYPKAPLMFN